jgi:tRNA threonylcarbamoyladenosine biosynthesis protein TsaB
MTVKLTHSLSSPESGMLVLALDTSTASLAAALVRGGETISEVQSLAERNHSVHTVSIVKSLLADNGISAHQLDGIAIGMGPGSYTGMRIAVSVGKTLAWAWDRPLVGVSSLESLAFGAWQKERLEPAQLEHPSKPVASNTQWFIPIMDARRGQVYTSSFAASSSAGTWGRLAKDGIRLMHDWVDELASLIQQLEPEEMPIAIWIVGDLTLHEAEADRLAAKLAPDEDATSIIKVRKLPFIMEGRSVAALGMKRLAAGERDDIHTFIPNYTQLTEAEVNLQAKTLKELGQEGAGNDDSK